MAIKVGDLIPDGKLSESTEFDSATSCAMAPKEVDVVEATKGKKIAVLGAGLIGAGWAARLSYAGHPVALYDPTASVEARAREVIGRGHTALNDLAGRRSPAEVRFTSALPKTRSAKVLRRAIRSVVTGDAPGDLSGLEDPATLDAIAKSA